MFLPRDVIINIISFLENKQYYVIPSSYKKDANHVHNSKLLQNSKLLHFAYDFMPELFNRKTFSFKNAMKSATEESIAFLRKVAMDLEPKKGEEIYKFPLYGRSGFNEYIKKYKTHNINNLEIHPQAGDTIRFYLPVIEAWMSDPDNEDKEMPGSVHYWLKPVVSVALLVFKEEKCDEKIYKKFFGDNYKKNARKYYSNFRFNIKKLWCEYQIYPEFVDYIFEKPYVIDDDVFCKNPDDRAVDFYISNPKRISGPAFAENRNPRAVKLLLTKDFRGVNASCEFELIGERLTKNPSAVYFYRHFSESEQYTSFYKNVNFGFILEKRPELYTRKVKKNSTAIHILSLPKTMKMIDKEDEELIELIGTIFNRE